MILVVGGTGRLGRELVARLTAADRRTRVLTRDPRHAQIPGVDVAIGDVRDPRSLTAAMRGVSTVVSAAHGFEGGRGAGPEQVDDRGNRNLIDAATVAGVSRFVLVSVRDARPDHPMSLHRAKYAAEQALRASVLPATVLRPSAFAETWLEIIGAKLGAGGPALVFGRADNPINFVSVQDVAAVLERVLAEPTLGAESIDLPGPDNLTMLELAQGLGATEVRHIPRGALRVLSTVLPPVAPAFARRTWAALVMDTIDQSADGRAPLTRFADIDRLSAADLAQRSAASRSVVPSEIDNGPTFP